MRKILTRCFKTDQEFVPGYHYQWDVFVRFLMLYNKRIMKQINEVIPVYARPSYHSGCIRAGL